MRSIGTKMTRWATLVVAMALATFALTGPAQASVSATAQQNIVDVAKSQLGQGPCPSFSPTYGYVPPKWASTATKEHHSCNGSGGAYEEWCSDFAAWVWGSVFTQDADQLDAWAADFQDKYAFNHGVQSISHTPHIGDAVLFGYTGGYADHVAIVVGISGSDITWIGGNQGNGQVTLSGPAPISSVSGFVSPASVPSTQGVIDAHYWNTYPGNPLQVGETLGYPTSNEAGTPDQKGRFNHFQRAGDTRPQASIYWTSAFGAWTVQGAIRDKWSALGWETNLGYPVTDESGTPDGMGRFNHFQRLGDPRPMASIYFTRQYGTWEIQGAIRDKWASQGWETGIGYPVTDESTTPDLSGKYNHFRQLNGAWSSIYFTPATGAWIVTGSFRDKWSSMGWERSCLGYPTSDEADNGATGLVQHFQHGDLFYNVKTGVTSSTC